MKQFSVNYVVRRMVDGRPWNRTYSIIVEAEAREDVPAVLQKKHRKGIIEITRLTRGY